MQGILLNRLSVRGSMSLFLASSLGQGEIRRSFINVFRPNIPLSDIVLAVTPKHEQALE